MQPNMLDIKGLTELLSSRKYWELFSAGEVEEDRILTQGQSRTVCPVCDIWILSQPVCII